MWEPSAFPHIGAELSSAACRVPAALLRAQPPVVAVQSLSRGVTDVGSVFGSSAAFS